MTRQLISISLLFALSVPLGSTWLIFAGQKQRIGREVEKRIQTGVEEGELVLLRIPRALEENPDRRFQRMHAREFRYQGVMYDVVRQEQRGDTTWYWCILDWDDTDLHNRLDEDLSRQPDGDPARRQAGERLQRFWQALYWNGAFEDILSTLTFPYVEPFCVTGKPNPGFCTLTHPPPEA